jgi:UDP:flavonoid glycosyltransferase YjiC (YdhE family)
MSMRVLFVSPPGICHFFPLVPLAWACRAAGHDVLYAFAEHTEEAANAGFPVIDVAPGYSKIAVADANPEQMAKASTDSLDDLNDFAPLLAEANRPMVDRLMAVADRWRPDLVVHEQVTTAGLLAAARAGVPAVQHNVAFTRTNGVHASVVKYLSDVTEKYGITGSPEPVRTVDAVPPSMLPGPPEGWPARFIPYNGGRVLPDWLAEPPARPRVAVTVGTLAAEFTGFGALDAILRVATDLDAEFVLALGDADETRYGDLPGNVRAAGWVPLNALLATSTAVVHHGGGSTTMTALESGVPQLIIPTLGDQPLNADAIRDRGVGLRATPDEVTASLIRQLIDDPALRTAAGEVRAEMRSLPAPASLVPRLEELAGK